MALLKGLTQKVNKKEFKINPRTPLLIMRALRFCFEFNMEIYAIIQYINVIAGW